MIEFDPKIKILSGGDALSRGAVLSILRDYATDKDKYGSQKALAKAIGISPQNLNDILKGKRPIMYQVQVFLGIREELVYRVIPQEDKCDG